MAQHVISIPIVGDTYIDSKNLDTNYSSTLNLYACYNGGIAYRFIYMKFIMSALPARKRIVSAALALYKNAATTNQYNLQVDKVDDSVDVPGITYNHKPSNWVDSKEYSSIQAGTGSVQIVATKAVINGYAVNTNTFEVSIKGTNTENISFNSNEAESNKPSLSVTYEDVAPDAPILLDPIGVYKDSAGIIRASWQYISSVGGTQKSYDLQWSTDKETWNTISEVTTNNYCDIPANTLPSGNIYWRVRCSNEYDEFGEYSAISAFYSIGAPAAPTVSLVPSNTARPVVEWSASTQQQVYQLQILQEDIIVYDSGEQPGLIIRAHKVKTFLADGTYNARIRIKNEYDLWSAWGEMEFSTATSKPDKPGLSMQNCRYGLELHMTSTAASYLLVYRSDYNEDSYICIAKLSSSVAEYKDNAVSNNGEYKYFVRAVSADDTYADSDIKFGQASFKSSLLSQVLDLNTVIEFKYNLNTPPKRSYQLDIVMGGVYYSGRTHPVMEPSEHRSAGISLIHYLKTYAELEAFLALYDRAETVLYRDGRGRKIYGTLSGFISNDERKGGYTVSFLLTQVDYIEEMEV